MSSKKPPEPEEKLRITLSVLPDVVRRMDDELARKSNVGSNAMVSAANRSEFVQKVVERYLDRVAVRPKDRREAHRRLCGEAGAMKLRTLNHKAMDNAALARQAGILAAARELEALAMVADDEASVSRHLVEALYLVREALGYKKLPEPPPRRR